MSRFLPKKSAPEPPRRRVEAAERSRELYEQSQGAFRRNQTLTGSSSSRVRSLSEESAHIKSPRVHAHTLAQQRRQLGLALVMVVLCAAFLYTLVSQFTASAVVMASPDSSIQLGDSYQQTIQSYLGDQPVERLRFLLNDAHLQEYMQAAHPEVKSIHVDGGAGFGASLFVVQLRTPIAGWSINGHQQYVDETGVAFTKNYFPSPAVQIVDKSGIQVETGQAVASNRFLGFVGQVVGMAKKQGFQATQVVIPSGTTRQVELHLNGVGYPIRLSVDRPAGEQVEDMAHAVRWMQSHGLSPEYIDVRVSGKAFYR